MSEPCPAYLFADSQLLFWQEQAQPFLARVRQHCRAAPRAAYIGASNGDRAEFYSLFVAAMQGIGIEDCCMIRSSLPPEDASLLACADIILLAGGEVDRGCRMLQETGARELVLRRYHEGCVLIGISAGAVQLGTHGVLRTAAASLQLIDALGVLPFLIGAHEEADDWAELSSVVKLLEGAAVGLGIPAGGGFFFHPDGEVQAIRKCIYEFAVAEGGLRRNLLFPAQQ
jgi:cyanophycinase